MNQIDRARAYLSKLPLAIACQGGHKATLLAACRLVEFGLAWQDAWPLLAEWNKTHCEPLWSERELTHKLKDAFKRTRPDPRFLNRAQSGAARSSGPNAGHGVAVRNAGHDATAGDTGFQARAESQPGQSHCQANHTPASQVATPEPTMPPAQGDSERKKPTTEQRMALLNTLRQKPQSSFAEQRSVTISPPPSSQARPENAPYNSTGSDISPGLRPALPKPAFAAGSQFAAESQPEPMNRPAPWKLTLRIGERREHKALASLRGLSVAAIELAVQRGLLRFGSWYRLPAWFILDKSNRVAQARRLDGLPWPLGGPNPGAYKPKTFNLPGSQATWPVGIQEAKPFNSIALVEGGPDLLAAFHFIIEQGRASDCAPVAVLGSGMTILPLALPLFAGKRVRIFPHYDRSGSEADARWTKQLMQAGAEVDSLKFESERGPVKDLNDLVRTPPPHYPVFP